MQPSPVETRIRRQIGQRQAVAHEAALVREIEAGFKDDVIFEVRLARLLSNPSGTVRKLIEKIVRDHAV